MRVVGKHRKNNVEGPRVVGFGLMAAGSMALVLSVAGAAGAGSNNAADPAHNQYTKCGVVYKDDGPVAQILQWQGKTNCQHNTTTTYNQNTTTTYKHCGCSTTTTEVVTTTSEQVAGTTITLETTTTAAPTTTTEASTTTTGVTTTTTNNLVGGSTTTTEDTTPDNFVPQGGTSTTISESPTGDTVGPVGPQIEVEPTSAVLPFTGSNTMPLAAGGVVMVLTGFGLSRRKRRLG